MAAKKPKRQSSKTCRRNGADARKKNLTLSAEAAERLDIHAAMTQESQSAIVERLILEGLKRFRVSDWDRDSLAPRLAEAGETEAA
jgi:hypothetical protein